MLTLVNSWLFVPHVSCACAGAAEPSPLRGDFYTRVATLLWRLSRACHVSTCIANHLIYTNENASCFITDYIVLHEMAHPLSIYSVQILITFTSPLHCCNNYKLAFAASSLQMAITQMRSPKTSKMLSNIFLVSTSYFPEHLKYTPKFDSILDMHQITPPIQYVT